VHWVYSNHLMHIVERKRAKKTDRERE